MWLQGLIGTHGQFGNWKDFKEFAKADVEDDEIIVKCVCQTD